MIQEKLNQPASISILSHRSPDGDSLGSSLAVYQLLKQMGHTVTVITPDVMPEFLQWLPAADTVLAYDSNTDQVAKKVAEAEIIFCLDFNNPSRLGPLEEVFKQNKEAFVINIDHHQEPLDFADLQLTVPGASSTAELIYDFIIDNGYKELMNKGIATCIYTGLLTDTGSFRFSSTSAKVHRIVSELFAYDIAPDKIFREVFDSYSVDRLKLLGFALNEKLRIYPEAKLAIIPLTQEELKRFNFKRGDTEGLVNYPLSIKNIGISVLITEKDGLVKLSFRSKGEKPVNQIAKEYFEGGGHLNAAGGISVVSVDATVNKLENIFNV
jgi:phosphoesterase RecJ-like protein